MVKILSLILAAAFFVAGLLTRSDYGINWDAPMLWLRGQAFAHFYLTGKDTYGLERSLSPFIIGPDQYASRYYLAPAEGLPVGSSMEPVLLPDRVLIRDEFDGIQKSSGKRISFYQDENWNGQYWIENDGPGHLPLIEILSAFSNRLFYQALGILGDIESYQLTYLFICSVGVFLVSIFAYQITQSFFASFIAGISLALFPIYFTEAHMNMRDPTQAVFFTGAVWAFWRWVKSNKLGWFGVFGVFGGLALGVKWNIVFLPFILIPWLILIRFKEWGRLGKLGILGGVGVILFLILIWPYAWADPMRALFGTINYYLETGLGRTIIQPSGFILPGGFNIYPLLLLLTQTPEIILLLGAVGVVGGIRGRGGPPAGGSKVGYLLLLWLLVPIIRLSFPGARTYGGIRQIMEVIPAMAILAGVGADYLVSVILRRLAEGSSQLGRFFATLRMTAVGMIAIILLIPIIQLHPNQNAYFNVLAGGLKGAVEKNLVDWTLTYGNIYKQAALWLNQNAEKDASLAHLAGSDYAISPFWLREDLSISPFHFSSFDQKGEYILALYNSLDPPVFAKRYPEKFLKPVHQIRVDGVPLLNIYKNEKKFSLINLDKEIILSNFIVQPKKEEGGDFWEIKMDQDYQITRIIVEDKGRCNKNLRGDELIFFIPKSKINEGLDPTKAFILNEKKDLGKDVIEYDFPAEVANVIKIYPLNNQSCFGQGKIVKVYVLD